MPYLELQKDNVKEEDQKNIVEVPEIEGMTIEEAIKELKKVNLEMQIENEGEYDKKTTIVKEQLPKKEIRVYEGTKIIVKY